MFQEQQQHSGIRWFCKTVRTICQSEQLSTQISDVELSQAFKCPQFLLIQSEKCLIVPAEAAAAWKHRGKWFSTGMKSSGFIQCCREKMFFVGLAGQQLKSASRTIEKITIINHSRLARCPLWSNSTAGSSWSDAHCPPQHPDRRVQSADDSRAFTADWEPIRADGPLTGSGSVVIKDSVITARLQYPTCFIHECVWSL